VQITSEGREQSDLTYNLRTDCGLTVVGREQSDLTHNSVNYQWRKGAQQPDAQYCSLWPYCCRKRAEWPDAQQCKLPVKEGSTATWRTILLTVSQTVVGREQSDLIDNTICCCTDYCWKEAKRPDGQHYLQLRRPLLEGSIADWLQHKLNNTELVEGSRRAGGPDENLVSIILGLCLYCACPFLIQILLCSLHRQASYREDSSSRTNLLHILETIIAQHMPCKLSLLSSDQINPKIITVHNGPVYIQISI